MSRCRRHASFPFTLCTSAEILSHRDMMSRHLISIYPSIYTYLYTQPQQRPVIKTTTAREGGGKDGDDSSSDVDISIFVVRPYIRTCVVCSPVCLDVSVGSSRPPCCVADSISLHHTHPDPVFFSSRPFSMHKFNLVQGRER